MTVNHWSRLKLTRSWWLFSELLGRVEVWNTSGDFAADVRILEDRSALEFLTPAGFRPPIAEWGLLVGDAVHNARSELDARAWDLAHSEGATPGAPHRVMFPVTKSEREWKSTVKSLETVPEGPLERRGMVTLLLSAVRIPAGFPPIWSKCGPALQRLRQLCRSRPPWRQREQSPRALSFQKFSVLNGGVHSGVAFATTVSPSTPEMALAISCRDAAARTINCCPVVSVTPSSTGPRSICCNRPSSGWTFSRAESSMSASRHRATSEVTGS